MPIIVQCDICNHQIATSGHETIKPPLEWLLIGDKAYCPTHKGMAYRRLIKERAVEIVEEEISSRAKYLGESLTYHDIHRIKQEIINRINLINI